MSWMPVLLSASLLSHSSPLWQVGAWETLLPLGCCSTRHCYGSVHDPPFFLRLRGVFSGAILSSFTPPPTMELGTPFASHPHSHSPGAAADPTDILFWATTFLGRQDALPAWERNWGRVGLLYSLSMATVVSFQPPCSLWSQWWSHVGRSHQEWADRAVQSSEVMQGAAGRAGVADLVSGVPDLVAVVALWQYKVHT